MYRFSHVAWLGISLTGLAACGSAPPPAPAPTAVVTAPRDILWRIVERYWDEHAPLRDAISAQALADSLAVERRYLAEALEVPPAGLDPASRLTYDIFTRQRRQAIEGFTYPAELLAGDPFDGVPQRFARLAADAALPAPLSVKDSEDWLRRIDDYAVWTRQSIANMREGMRRGYTSPRALIERSVGSLQRLGEDTPGNLFYADLGSRAAKNINLDAAIKERLLPAYRALHDFLQREYLPLARVGLALSDLPLGPSWYAYRVRCATSADLTPSDIHSLGVAEVERLRARLPGAVPPGAVPPGAGAPGAALLAKAAGAGAGMGAGVGMGAGAGIAEEGGLVEAYGDLKSRTLAALPALFSAVPPRDFEIRAGGPLRQNDAPLVYQRADPARGAPAILFVNSLPGTEHPIGVVISSFLEEALPGHHYQSSLQEARTDLPRFRRFGTEPAFVDGWGLYAASLGEELGLYRDEAARSGALMRQIACAAALVIDTGLHAEGWTRAQAEDYLHKQLDLSTPAADLMIERIAARPADALACLMGELKMQALRAQALQALGTRFDIREFHSELIKDGAMPLDILEAKMKAWLETRR